MRYVADDHFTTGSWAADGPLRLRSYSCVLCGHRATTWAGFRAHRRVCLGHQGRLLLVRAAGPATGEGEREAA